MKKTILVVAIPIILGSIGFAILLGSTPEKNGMNHPSVNTHQTQKINLALRQTAHRLLQQIGDSTSRIAPIEQTTDHVFLVKIERAFNYDSLPIFLQNSFFEHGIEKPYDVTVWDCDYAKMILGYASFDVTENKNVPCLGRTQTVECLNFTVTFTEKMVIFDKNNWITWFLISLLMLAGTTSLYYFFIKEKAKSKTDNQIQPVEQHIIQIGKTIFDTRQHRVNINKNEQKLSERESKLLQLFCQNPNALLVRDFILKEVWEDEGVLVTRTVDVYVSRLRKLLKEDAALKIVNVHGRGYRFEVVEI